ncbi:MAG: PIG-L family deacetylase [Planctomycetes bacterium]|nr:PIG-L family deacetylase [Planctomycetota bacterium]
MGTFIILSGAAASRQPAPRRDGTTTRTQAAKTPAPVARADDGKLRIICFGAHPDDCELRAAGVAALWTANGHHVKFVSVTNGDIGHWKMAGGPLAQRRAAEVQRCADILGSEAEVLDIHDGELLPTLENRKTITRLIREWNADIVMCHRPNDYHPDHRNVGLLVQDAAYMVTVPFFCPDVPPLEKNPVFLYFEDRFQKPNPFAADVVVAIDDVIDKKLACVEALESQFYEGGCCSGVTRLPDDPAAQATRRRDVLDRFRNRFASTADRFRRELAGWYGDEAAGGIRYAEAFEICEYGRRPTREELQQLFPFFAEDVRDAPPDGAAR